MTAVLAIGSPFGADRVGWQIAECLQEKGVPNVHLCRHPLDLLPYFSRYHHCLVIDAMHHNQGRGTLLPIAVDQLRPLECRNVHGLSLYELIQLARTTEQLPEDLQIVGVEINGKALESFTDLEVDFLSAQVAHKYNL